MESNDGGPRKATLILSGGITFSGTLFGSQKPVDGEIGMIKIIIKIKVEESIFSYNINLINAF